MVARRDELAQALGHRVGSAAEVEEFAGEAIGDEAAHCRVAKESAGDFGGDVAGSDEFCAAIAKAEEGLEVDHQVHVGADGPRRLGGFRRCRGSRREEDEFAQGPRPVLARGEPRTVVGGELLLRTLPSGAMVPAIDSSRP